MKRAFVSMPWRKFILNTWTKVIITDPNECTFIAIPQTPAYIVYKAYFPSVGADKVFDIILPYNSFKHNLLLVFPKGIDLTKPVQLEIKKLKNLQMELREWK